MSYIVHELVELAYVYERDAPSSIRAAYWEPLEPDALVNDAFVNEPLVVNVQTVSDETIEVVPPQVYRHALLLRTSTPFRLRRATAWALEESPERSRK